MGHCARVDVDDALPEVVDGQPPGVVDLADDGGLDVPLVDDGHEGVQVLGSDRFLYVKELGGKDYK